MSLCECLLLYHPTYFAPTDNVSKISKKKYSQNAFRFCNRAYNLIFHNYRSCQFTANDQTLTRLITIFPKMMNFVGIMKELQDKAMMNLLVSSHIE